MSSDPISTAREAALAEVFVLADGLTQRLEAIALNVSKSESVSVAAALSDFKASLTDGIVKSNERIVSAIHDAQATRNEPAGNQDTELLGYVHEAVAEMRNLGQIIKGTTAAFSEDAKELGAQMHKTQVGVDDSIKALATFKVTPGVKQTALTPSPLIKAVPYKKRTNTWLVAGLSCVATAAVLITIHSLTYNSKHAALGAALSKGWNELEKNTRADLSKVLKDQSLAR